MKRKISSLILLSLLGAAMALTNGNFSTRKALAEDHTHTFVDHVCSCGTRVFECEEGLIEGRNTSTDPNDKMINDFSPSDNPDHPVSGTGFVEYMAQTGNKITWKFNLSKQLLNVKCHLWVSTGQDNKATNSLGISINGQKGKWKTQTVEYPGNDYWYYFLDCVFYLNFAEGNNVLVLENQTMYSFNFDSIEAEMPTDVVYSAYKEGEPNGEMPIDGPAGDGEDDPGSQTDKYTELDSVVAKNTFVMEGEYCDSLYGTNLTGDGWFGDNDNYSGGGMVTNFGTKGDNVCRFVFNTDKAVSKATITCYVANIDRIEWSDIFIPRINGGSGGAPEFDRWPNCFGISLDELGYNETCPDMDTPIPVVCPSCELLEGKNIFEIEAWEGKLTNIDYVEIKTDEDVTFTYTPRDRGFGGKGGAASVEAEASMVRGVSSDANNPEFVMEQAATTGRATSEGKCVGNFATANNTLTFYFKSNLAVESFKMSLFVAPLGNGGETAKIIKFTINGNEVNFDQAQFPAGNKENIEWKELTISSASITAGLNKVVLTNISGEDFLIDNLYLDVAKNINISTKNLDAAAPTISTIKFLTKGIRTQHEVEFTFTVSDDFNEVEELKIEVTVYYDLYGKNQKKLEVKNNKFTPDYLGKYTVTVSVTDTSNHTTTAKRYLVVKYGENKVEKQVKYVDKKKVGGWVIFGVGAAIGVGLIAYMIIDSKKKFGGTK